jgi:hypothetical protein
MIMLFNDDSRIYVRNVNYSCMICYLCHYGYIRNVHEREAEIHTTRAAEYSHTTNVFVDT